MSFHIYRAVDQPATRYAIALLDRNHWVKNPPNRLLPTSCCKVRRKPARRPAKNLIAHVYYDGTYFFCRKGKGCNKGVK
jgi:hypothetical protein